MQVGSLALFATNFADLDLTTNGDAQHSFVSHFRLHSSFRGPITSFLHYHGLSMSSTSFPEITRGSTMTPDLTGHLACDVGVSSWRGEEPGLINPGRHASMLWHF